MYILGTKKKIWITTQNEWIIWIICFFNRYKWAINPIRCPMLLLLLEESVVFWFDCKINYGCLAGKSTASNYLRSQGYTVVDCDKLGHKVYISFVVYKRWIGFLYWLRAQYKRLQASGWYIRNWDRQRGWNDQQKKARCYRIQR